MKIVEIKNNLVKVTYEQNETPIMGKFIVIMSNTISYVGQIVNLKSDIKTNILIAKLIFTFTQDGVVDTYDGSQPSIESQVSLLKSTELIDLLPIETPIEVGNLAQESTQLKIDISVFENNFAVFTDSNYNIRNTISNFIIQLFGLKEKSIVLDTENIFDGYKKVHLSKDFKIPLNAEMIDYIFDYELDSVDMNTKAIIKDIFYSVQQYIKTLEYGFIPIDNFVDVVTNQYKETQMPELALLKNKLLKYRDLNIFANSIEEFVQLRKLIMEKNTIIIDIKSINEKLQIEVISLIHSILTTLDQYAYFFVPINNNNSNKKLLTKFINHDHVFTTIFVPINYKYTTDLLRISQNTIIFKPISATNNFINYNTFFSKLSQDECIVIGKLTHHVPFITNISEGNNLNITLEDVLGEKYQFIPIKKQGEVNIPFTTNIQNEENTQEKTLNKEDLNYDNTIENDTTVESINIDKEDVVKSVDKDQQLTDNQYFELEKYIEKEENLSINEDVDEEITLEEDLLEGAEEEPLSEDELLIEDAPLIEDEILTEDELNYIEETHHEDFDKIYPNNKQEENEPSFNELDDIYQNNNTYSDIETDIVPIYPTDEDSAFDETFERGDEVTHPRYGRGVIEKIINYGNKVLCSISFENVGRRLLDPTISELTKV